MQGKLYGVGVGPGDPALMTIKAVQTITACDILAIPSKSKDNCMALDIVKQGVEGIEDKPLLEVNMPMTKDPDILEAAYSLGADLLCEKLDQGLNVAFITIGDPSVYSTYMYLHKKVTDKGYETHIIPGVPSFCACAAALNTSLCEGSDELHIIPGTYTGGQLTDYPGTKVLMKNDRALSSIRGTDYSVSMVENCTLPTEKVYRSLEEIPEEAGYFSVLIVKKER
ncbi:MAG: precorrin-2 C(20)-methyltransferase [Parasporobacterium sp.]|nr:precorrin-2 C(20)-methyltransferase [Parasporobacterium sp.]